MLLPMISFKASIKFASSPEVIIVHMGWPLTKQRKAFFDVRKSNNENLNS